MFDDQVVVGYDVSLCISRTTRVNLEVWFLDIPSGKHTKNYWTSPFLMGKSAISMAIFNSKLLVYQRVYSIFPLKSPFSTGISIVLMVHTQHNWCKQPKLKPVRSPNFNHFTPIPVLHVSTSPRRRAWPRSRIPLAQRDFDSCQDAARTLQPAGIPTSPRFPKVVL